MQMLWILLFEGILNSNANNMHLHYKEVSQNIVQIQLV